MWNGVEAHNMYRMLVVVYNSHVSHFILTSAIIAWGVPFVLLSTILVVDRTAFYGYYQDCKFRCGLKDNTLYYAWLSPMLVIIIHNIVIFTMVMRVLFTNSPKLNKNDQERKSYRSRLVGALTLLVLLGVPWILSAFGAIKNESGDSVEIFKGIIAIILVTFISLQGLFIFLFHCACNRSVRNEWSSSISWKDSIFKNTNFTTATSSNTKNRFILSVICLIQIS
ncbi:hypothetical protein HELRODRAFT_193249 [Helobdella robusta]|uniref:G-protein coupled receptors family 2 profile 2 domain-containing protein n=1 Tax=Helobdella robusta TaxID=6412 RepID=T1FUS7_HELRO|nr:hypothetical protein HELRODRAFT_193249 [Helobdella robusta]ESN97603.1 hypothetical protein HELRODRAFT_193249 [Helobdella robusta]